MGNKKQVKTVYEKRSDFKTTAADGVFGGINNSGEININFFIETTDIPTSVIIEVDDKTGQIIKEISREQRDAIIREIPFAVNIKKEVAKSVVVWLNERINEIERQQQQIANQKERS